ncbi:YceI family protein [Luminiphilus syltensis]|uniref:YceI family protein n=1 Tax=Luminiphilus syltensis TaxID=1341119 RepID=UPI0002F459A6|nr:YceI family protein [Luminiphilus syltensis]
MQQAIFIAAALLAFSMSALAEWSVQPGSTVGYVSVKNNAIAENNRFSTVTGGIDGEGQIRINVDLGSVQTGVPIRNERMRDKFFEIASWPEAVITAQLEPADIAHLDAGVMVERELALSVSLHGSQTVVNATLRAMPAEAGVRVSTVEPVILNADDFGLGGGVAMLQELAGLQGISRAIPVTVDLMLTSD